MCLIMCEDEKTVAIFFCSEPCNNNKRQPCKTTELFFGARYRIIIFCNKLKCKVA